MYCIATVYTLVIKVVVMCIGVVCISLFLKKELTWAADKQPLVISSTMLFKYVVISQLKNKALAMWSLVMCRIVIIPSKVL